MEKALTKKELYKSIIKEFCCVLNSLSNCYIKEMTCLIVNMPFLLQFNEMPLTHYLLTQHKKLSIDQS
jgi:hypothetical protein